MRAEGATAEARATLARFSESGVREDGSLILALDSPDALPDVIRQFVEAGAEIYEVVPQREPLEELFVRIMGEDRGL